MGSAALGRTMPTPQEALDSAYQAAMTDPERPRVTDAGVQDQIAYVCRYTQNRAPARMLLAALAAKIAMPQVDIRKPYTEIGGADTYSGRGIDETYVTAFIQAYQLPLNETTAFLTPAFRMGKAPLTVGMNIIGRPRRLYDSLLALLEAVAEGRVSPEELLVEVVRQLLILQREGQARMAALLNALRREDDAPALSVEQIVTLLQQHLAVPRSSRLPVLAVAAVYRVIEGQLGERLLPLGQHNAADSQTGALGDIEVTLIGDDAVITCYEVKMRQVRVEDIDHALAKIATNRARPDNYLFITTEPIAESVARHAQTIYAISGVEVAVLDCLSFVRYFLHLFHRHRMDYLNAYQNLLLQEPDSGVGQPVKEAFLALRRAAESVD